MSADAQVSFEFIARFFSNLKAAFILFAPAL